MSFSVAVVAPLDTEPSGPTTMTRILLDGLTRARVVHRLIDLGQGSSSGARRTARRLGRLSRVYAGTLTALCRLPPPVVLYAHLGQSPRAVLRDLPLLALARATRTPLVLHAHGVGLREALEAVPAWASSLHLGLIGSTTHVVALSRGLADQLPAALRARATVVPNGVELSLESAAAAFERPPPGSAPLRVLHLGGLRRAKGVDVLLDAAEASQRLGRDHRFALVGPSAPGEPSWRAELTTRGLRNVVLRGPVRGDERLRCLFEADVLALPSRREGLPVSVLEGMHCGLPVIATRVGALPELLEDGRNVLFVPNDDPLALVKALDRLKEDRSLRANMSGANVRLARDRFSASAHVQGLLSVLCRAAQPALDSTPVTSATNTVTDHGAQPWRA